MKTLVVFAKKLIELFRGNINIDIYFRAQDMATVLPDYLVCAVKESWNVSNEFGRKILIFNETFNG